MGEVMPEKASWPEKGRGRLARAVQVRLVRATTHMVTTGGLQQHLAPALLGRMQSKV